MGKGSKKSKPSARQRKLKQSAWQKMNNDSSKPEKKLLAKHEEVSLAEVREKSEGEVPSWILDLTDELAADIDRPLPEDLKQLKAIIHRRSAEFLARMDKSKLGGWRLRWAEYRQSLNEALAHEDELKETLSALDAVPQPEWLDYCERELAGAWASTVNLKALKRQPALVFGGMVGHEYATWQKDESFYTARIKDWSGPLADFLRVYLEWEKPHRLEMVNKAIKIATAQTFEQSQAFFRGFSVAIQKGTLKETGELAGGSTTTMIYFLLWLHGGFIADLKSVRELHEWLRLFFPRDVLGHQKRIEKVCERIGLSFRPPGRPPKSDNSPASPS